MQTLNDIAKVYAERCLKTGDLQADIAAAYLDGYQQAQTDIVLTWPVPVGNRWWYYDAKCLPGGAYATHKEGSENPSGDDEVLRKR